MPGYTQPGSPSRRTKETSLASSRQIQAKHLELRGAKLMSNDDRIPSMDALGRLDDGVLARLHPGIGSLVSREFGIAPVTRLPLGHTTTRMQPGHPCAAWQQHGISRMSRMSEEFQMQCRVFPRLSGKYNLWIEANCLSPGPRQICRFLVKDRSFCILEVTTACGSRVAQRLTLAPCFRRILECQIMPPLVEGALGESCHRSWKVP